MISRRCGCSWFDIVTGASILMSLNAKMQLRWDRKWIGMSDAFKLDPLKGG